MSLVSVLLYSKLSATCWCVYLHCKGMLREKCTVLLGQDSIVFKKNLSSADDWLVISVLPLAVVLTMNSVVRGCMTMLEDKER